MNRILITIAVLLMIHSSFMLCGAEVKNRYIDTKYFELASKYQFQGSFVYGSEPDKDSCNEGDNNYFGYKGPINEINDFVDKISVIDSWSRLKVIRQRYIHSPLLSKLKQSDFSRYHFAVIMISITGFQYIEKEKLIEKNRKVYFSYEIWDKTYEPQPACLGFRLCVLKLKKRPI